MKLSALFSLCSLSVPGAWLIKRRNKLISSEKDAHYTTGHTGRTAEQSRVLESGLRLRLRTLVTSLCAKKKQKRKKSKAYLRALAHSVTNISFCLGFAKNGSYASY